MSNSEDGSLRNLQHQEVGNNKLGGVKKSADSLLVDLGSVTSMRDAARGSLGSHLGRVAAVLIGLVGTDRSDEFIHGILADEETIVLLSSSAETLEKNAKKDDADARTSKHATALDVP